MPENYPHHLRGLRQPWDPQAPHNAFERATAEYDATRPDYPEETVTAALGCADATGLVVADIGAGTGKLTAPLYRRGANVIAVEPAAAMRQQCAVTMRRSEALAGDRGRPRWRLVDATAESTTLPDASVDVVTYAQCWHWLDREAALSEAARILRDPGRIAIVANQMDVTVPWVHRLTRIMRSGDVLRPEHVPQLRGDFTAAELHRADFTVTMRPPQIMALARTRSSYLKSSPKNREKMQENLRWYLLDHLGFSAEDDVTLPYYALTWTAHLKARSAASGGKIGLMSEDKLVTENGKSLAGERLPMVNPNAPAAEATAEGATCACGRHQKKRCGCGGRGHGHGRGHGSEVASSQVSPDSGHGCGCGNR